MISILMVTLNGFSSRFPTWAKIVELNSIYWIFINIIHCISLVWRLSYILLRNLSKKISAGIGVARIFNISKMDTQKIQMNINHFILWLGSTCSRMVAIKFISHTVTLSLTLIWIHWLKEYRVIHLQEIYAEDHHCVRPWLETEWMCLLLLKIIHFRIWIKAMLLSRLEFIQGKRCLRTSVMAYWIFCCRRMKRQRNFDRILYLRLYPCLILMGSFMAIIDRILVDLI